MQKTYIKKIEGGKLLRLDINFENKINSIKITGDFFLHPEETLIEIEHSLTNLYLPINIEETTRNIENILEINNAELIGVSANDIAKGLEEITYEI